MLQAKAISEMPSGGQICCCAQTFTALQHLPEDEVSARVLDRPDQELLARALRQAAWPHSMHELCGQPCHILLAQAQVSWVQCWVHNHIQPWDYIDGHSILTGLMQQLLQPCDHSKTGL